MNEQLFTNAHGLRLIQEYEGAPRLKARLCEGNSFELSYGVTFDLNGNPFTADSTCTPEESDALFRNALELFERGVRELVTVPLNSNQFSGLTAFAWNIGLANFATSSVLRRVNENRMDDAAACFGMWIFATNGAGHKQALRGLLRRRYAESCLFMSYQWEQACDTDAIALQREIPETLPGTDRVIYRTPFKDVLAVAQRYPLEAELVLTTKADPAAVPASGAAGQPAPQPSQAQAAPAPPSKPGATSSPASSPAPSPKPPQGTSVAPVPVPARPEPPLLPTPAQQREGVNGSTTPGIDPSSPKSMLLSRRFWGLLMVISGRVVFAIWGTDTLLKLGSDPLVSEMVANVMVMMAASAWEYCGEMLHTWGKARAKRMLR